MLNRRNIRSKVMQGIFAYQGSGSDNIPKNEKLLFQSFENIYKLYILLLLFLIALRERANEEIEVGLNKNFPTHDDLNPNYKFVNNRILQMLFDNSFIKEFKEKNRLNKWEVNKELVDLVWKKIKKSKLYKEYMNSGINSFTEDKDFILNLYKNFIAPEEKLHESLEADESHWADDIAIANTLVMKTISALKENDYFQSLPELFKDEQDREFAKDLFRIVIQNDEKLNSLIKGKTPNWDFERISLIDKLILKMGLTEFLYFPSIPPSVSMNEYVELAKEFSTPKSNIFINGVLNKIYKELDKKGEIKKNIRGRIKK